MQITLYYHWQQYDFQSYEEGKVVVYLYEDACSDYLTFIKKLEITIPDVKPPAAERIVLDKIAMLQKEKQQLQADVEVKIAAVDDKIRQLSALEYKPEAGVSYD